MTLLALLGWLACAGLLGWGTQAYLTASQRSTLAGLTAQSQAAAAALEQTMLRVFEVVQAQLELMESRDRLVAKREDAGALGIEQHPARSVAANRFGLTAAAFLGPDGRVRYSTDPAEIGSRIGDPDAVAAQLRGELSGLAIGRPVSNPANGRWTLLVTRPMRDTEGRVQGVGVIRLDPLALSADLATQVAEPGRIAILRGLPDGTILARSRDAEADVARRPAPDHALIRAALAAPAGTVSYRRARDSRPVLTSWRVPPGLPLVVAAVIDLDAELAGLRIHALAVITAASVMALVCLALALSAGGWIEAQQERASLAEAMAQQRRDILATLAHEIRTPLTGMLGFSELLAEAQLPADQARQAATVVESGRVLLALLNDILDLAKLEAGKISLERLAFRPVELLESAAALAEGAARAKGLTLVLDLAPDLPPWAAGDPIRIRQILGNLLSNAVKFTHRGRITLAARVESRQADGGIVLAMEVADTGIGIAAEVLPRLFGVFEQASAGISRHYGGTGLGLAICRRLAEGMGGSIGVGSEPGAGSRFQVHLPLGGAVAPEAPVAAALATRPLSVLLADDARANLALLQSHLATAGHRTTTAQTGVEAVAAAQAEAFDVILLDLNMPEMDGAEAARHIRSGNGPNRATPILALTAGAMEEDRALVRDAGMDAHLVKPIARAALLAAVAAAAGEAGLRPGVAA